MARIWFVRHQAENIVHKYPFAQRPTEEQLAPVRRWLLWLHGPTHPKSGAPYWLEVVSFDVLGPGEVPQIEALPEPVARQGRPSGAASVSFGDVEMSGRGAVRNPAAARSAGGTTP